MLNINDFVALYDNEVGVIWAPEYGEVRLTTPSHAQLIKDYLEKNQHKEIQDDERDRFSEYILNYFQTSKKLTGIRFQKINERTDLNRVEIVITNSCNLNCKYCYADGGSYGLNKHYISPEDVSRYIGALLSAGYRSINEIMFFGGEPTLYPNTINEVCKCIKKKYEEGVLESLPVFTMVTNGTRINEYIAEVIKKYHILVTISIDGPVDVNDSLRVDVKGEGTFDRICAGVNQLKKRGVNIRLIEATYTTLHKKMGYSREWVKEYLSSKFGVKDVLIADCEDIASSHGYACNDIEESIEYAIQNADKSIRARLIKSMNSRPKYLECSCEGGFANLSITPGGDIYPCHMYIGHEKYRIAQFINDKYDFNENVYNFLKLGQKNNGKCKKCWARFYCSICPAMIGLSESSLDYMCQQEKELQRKLVLKYTKGIFLYNQNKEEKKHA